ncbi:asparagine synthetase [Citrifermentans bemidjiense Bem]|uniref:asparagine synthase (glutamine-hydrolyzing) n=1 Tax=Citrifermentans bemidjiense (strain ATCC BAA-1014 / DSM 16622 / JCM 12645 / Bem) TaxID=404380 RepID=B5EA88_CITBB|nr:asparagine synthase (glutamine-hydrolyzing) [Citrifermentans bemidjiense]ACH38794.1 asparagine synthetase [Citrifermentans bemidjiense Bem]
MCGIAGFFRTLCPEGDTRLLRRMGEVISHRGPDASGEFLDEEVGLSHRRLSILDLSPLGNQPMHSLDGRYVIVFNGEIYNFLELRGELEREGVSFRSRTDTEVILALYAREGVACLKRLNGMFAFALWDRDTKTLLLARDRIGKKPLYYYHAGGDRIAFASEIKSLLEVPGVERQVEPTAVADYLKYLYIPAPKTIYRRLYKLPPAHCLELKAGEEPRIREYWDVEFKADYGLTPEAAEEELLDLLQKATACRMIADVPLGAFLSGGVDSSAVVALMARAAQEPVKTCSIGFDDKRHDETPYAREVARLFATEHKEYRVSADLAGTVALLPRFFDEPFADSSALPTYHVSRLARQSVTVALAGDGGDESFAGYQKYAIELKEDLARRAVPRALLSLIGKAAGAASHPLLRKVRSLTTSALMEPAAAYYRTNTFVEDDLLAELLSEPFRRACAGYDPAEQTTRYFSRMQGADHVTAMLYTDLKSYLPGDILVKVDRMSMAHSLEVRAPFLDYRIVEFAARLPSSWKISGGEKKIILRKAFGRLLPDSVLNRPKQGFTVPLDTWFKKELREFAGSRLLDDPTLSQYLSLNVVRRVWEEHQQDRARHGTLLWSLLMLALWHQEYQGGAPCSK